jgi:signal peptidase I
MADKPYPEHEVPPSRRERRELRETQRREQRQKKWSNFTKTMSRALIGSSKKKARVESLRKETQEFVVPTSRRAAREEREKQGRAKRLRKWRGGLAELVFTIIIAFVLVFGVVRPFIVAAYKIPSASMVPTLEIGDRILANKSIYYFTEPQRGDIVVFKSVDENDDETLIKRVVGVAGDKIRLRQGTLYVNGIPQEEPYLNQNRPTKDSYGPERVPEGNIFVMGDNRDNSADSRVFGFLPLENVEGEAFVRFWPIPQIGRLAHGGTLASSDRDK